MMTQEELDTLVMSKEIDLGAKKMPEDFLEDETENTFKEYEKNEDFSAGFIDPHNFKVEAGKKWPPPPPTQDHKVVRQLDDVTRDSEVKASQIFDQLDFIGGNIDKILKSSKEVKKILDNNEEVFGKLSSKFPDIELFANSLEASKQASKTLKVIIDEANECSDASLQAIDIMQFQDIHRQKIERVINVMRALAQYMNSLFEGKIDDNKRVSSAVYIAGDDKDDMASEEDIEALIASFGKK